MISGNIVSSREPPGEPQSRGTTAEAQQVGRYQRESPGADPGVQSRPSIEGRVQESQIQRHGGRRSECERPGRATPKQLPAREKENGGQCGVGYREGGFE